MGNKPLTSFLQRLVTAREQAGLSQGQVAGLLKVHRPIFSEIEAGHRNIKADQLTKLSYLYNVSISWLENGKSEFEDPKIELAARELSQLNSEELERIITLLKTLRVSEKISG